MVLATLLGIVFVPVLFVAFEMLSHKAGRLVRRRGKETTKAAE